MTQPTLATLTQSYQPEEKLASFATTNALLQLTAMRQQPMVHYWQLPQTVILGLLDQRLPNLAAGLQVLQQAGYPYFLRNSGGLAVVVDPGVLNVSLFLPAQRNDYSITAAYQLMTTAVQAAWPMLPIQAGEIAHSYCPGAYDLSIHGQKIAGMSQRRTADALVIMLYMSINGDQTQRSQLIQDFYTAGLATQPDDRFPQVIPEVMTSVAAAQGAPLTIQQAIENLNAVWQQDYQLDQQLLPTLIAEPEFQAQFNHAYHDLARRQARLN